MVGSLLGRAASGLVGPAAGAGDAGGAVRHLRRGLCAGLELVCAAFFRWLGGVAVGGASVVCPMYITEIAPAKRRGLLVAVSQLNIVVGVLAAYFSNYLWPA